MNPTYFLHFYIDSVVSMAVLPPLSLLARPPILTAIDDGRDDKWNIRRSWRKPSFDRLLKVSCL